jgi:hypothetical protein
MIDVKNKKCNFQNCNTTRIYGFLGKGAISCSIHKHKGMIISPNHKCNTLNCKLLGSFELDTIRYCENHAPINGINLGLYPCTICGLDDILTNGICVTCDPTIVNIRKHNKENRVKDILTVSGINYIHDKILEELSCGRERPDFQIDCGTHFVYIEVDEHQHRSYIQACEQTRMLNLVHVRGIPVRFIRYNPDSYIPVDGQSICKPTQREKKLMEYVKYAIKHSPTIDSDFANILYLFYDNYDTTFQKWVTLIK